MLNDKGRKMVGVRMGNNQQNFDHYKGMHSEHAQQFDEDWNRVAG